MFYPHSSALPAAEGIGLIALRCGEPCRDHRVRLDFDGPIQYHEYYAELACLGWY